MKRYILLIIVIALLTQVSFSQEAITVNGVGAIVSASSFCDEYENASFTPSQAFNGDPDIHWMASGKFNPKKGEWLKITFTKPVRLYAIRISPGFGKGDMYFKYSRWKKLQVTLNKISKKEKRLYHRYIDSDPKKDAVLLYPTAPKVKSITFKILDIYEGSKSNYALVGNIEPVFLKDGAIISSSNALSDILHFLRSSKSPSSAASFLPIGKPLIINRFIENVNPLDKSLKIVKKQKITRSNIRKIWSIWSYICYQLWYDYQFNTYQTVNYIWKEPSQYAVFELSGSMDADSINTYTIYVNRQKTKEKIKTKDSNGKEKEEIVSVIKTIIERIDIHQGIYTP